MGKHSNLDTYWERTVNSLREKVLKSKDKTMIEFVKNMNEIKDEVKAECINRYLKRCELKHALAFFQWRYMYPPKHSFCSESQQQMKKVFRDSNTHIFNHIDISKQPTDRTKE
jgi:hypothetical protein